MDDKDRQSAFVSALTTEHFVLQTASTSTITEAAGRSSLYVMSLSSSLVAMGFTADAPRVFTLFAGSALPAVFLLGVFTTVRLVDTTLENQQYLAGIARIRSYYRQLTPEAAQYFSPESGRWPEATGVPSLGLGQLPAFLGTTASMIAFINSLVAGAAVVMLVTALHPHRGLAMACGAASVIALMAAFLGYQRWRMRVLKLVRAPVTPQDSSS